MSSSAAQRDLEAIIWARKFKETSGQEPNPEDLWNEGFIRGELSIITSILNFQSPLPEWFIDWLIRMKNSTEKNKNNLND